MDNFVLIKNGYFYELILKWFLFCIINVNFKIKNLDNFWEVILYIVRVLNIIYFHY